MATVAGLEVGERDAEVAGAVGGQHAGAAAIGDDGEPVAADRGVWREHFGRGEELPEGHGAHHAGPLQGSIEDGVGADQRAGMGARRPRAAVVPPGLEHDHRLGARRHAQAAHEGAGIA